MKRICVAVALLIVALSCSRQVEKVNVTGRLVKSNGAPVVGVPVYLVATGKGYMIAPSEDDRLRNGNKSDKTGRFTTERDCRWVDPNSMRETEFTIVWGVQLNSVSSNGKRVVFKIDCTSKEINLGDLVSVNLNAVEADRFIIIGTLHKSDGSPIGGAKLTLQAAAKRGKALSFSFTYDNQGSLVNPVGESDGNGEFAISVDRSFPKKEQNYAIKFELTLSELFGRSEVLTVVLSRDKSPLLFKIDGEPRQMNLGDFIVEAK